MTTCILSATLTVVMADVRDGGPAGTAPLTFIALAVGLLLAALLPLRRRQPEILWIASVIAPLLLPLDSLPSLVVLASVITHLSGPRLPIAAVGTGLATWVSLWRDTRGGSLPATDGVPQSSSVWNWDQPGEWSWFEVSVTSAALVGTTIAVAWLWRSRTVLAATRSQVRATRRAVDQLNSDIARRKERERIALEVHDALGHRLSLLSLEAGALEVEGSDTAANIRVHAQQAMTDLRSLLSALDDPERPDTTRAPFVVTDVPALIDEVLSSGAPVVSSVVLTGADEAPTLVSHSAYRIVQELLTNARKHAPGSPVRLEVHCTPGVGIDISATNRVPDGAELLTRERVAPGRGLNSVAERVDQCGGRWRAWVEGSVYRAAIQLPWVTRSTTPATTESAAVRSPFSPATVGGSDQ
ncbi:sensor histidine kinase [Propionibacteriaceae bacterium Y1685]|uniref:sensor histidine kinase n=1 Tax=Microlunatus sp. Y1700 TaxID=3418487 RepID=UPI003B78A23A